MTKIKKVKYFFLINIVLFFSFQSSALDFEVQMKEEGRKLNSQHQFVIEKFKSALIIRCQIDSGTYFIFEKPCRESEGLCVLDLPSIPTLQYYPDFNNELRTALATMKANWRSASSDGKLVTWDNSFYEFQLNSSTGNLYSIRTHPSPFRGNVNRHSCTTIKKSGKLN